MTAQFWTLWSLDHDNCDSWAHYGDRIGRTDRTDGMILLYAVRPNSVYASPKPIKIWWNLSTVKSKMCTGESRLCRIKVLLDTKLNVKFWKQWMICMLSCVQSSSRLCGHCVVVQLAFSETGKVIMPSRTCRLQLHLLLHYHSRTVSDENSQDEILPERCPPPLAVSYTHLTLPTIYSV